MKEKEFKELLMQSRMDDFMDKKIMNNLLSYNTDDNSLEAEEQNSYKYRKLVKFATKAASVVLVLFVIGGATAWAAGLLVKTYPVDIKTVTEKELEKLNEEKKVNIDEYLANREIKRFGDGNKMKGPAYDTEGNILKRDEYGNLYYTDGSIIESEPDQWGLGRIEKDKKNGDEAFAEIGLPNLIPDYIYENYKVAEGGFVYSESNIDGKPYKNVMVSFFPEYTSPEFSNLTGNDLRTLLKKRIWFTITPVDRPVENTYVYLTIVGEDSGKTYSYTTSSGILCNIREDGNIIVFINYSSEIYGNGQIMLEFSQYTIDEVKAILDKLTLIEDFSQN